MGLFVDPGDDNTRPARPRGRNNPETMTRDELTEHITNLRRDGFYLAAEYWQKYRDFWK